MDIKYKSNIMNNRILTVILVLLTQISCTKMIDNRPDIIASVNKLGEYIEGQTLLNVERTDVAVFRFDIASNGAAIKKIELWKYTGYGVNATQPQLVKKWEEPADHIGNQFLVSSSVIGQEVAVNTDVQYSVYVEDMNGNYASERVQIFVDLTRYDLVENSLYTGNVAATSKTFLNLQSGRTLPVGQTIADPSGVDLGFAWMPENPDENPANACLVSFNQYWRTGIYNMLGDENNGSVKFRKAPDMTEEEFDDLSINRASLVSIYEKSTIMDPPEGSGFLKEDEAIAANVKVGDVFSVKTKDGRYGLFRVLSIDTRKDNENIQLSILISKR